jgi:hypothetical protein
MEEQKIKEMTEGRSRWLDAIAQIDPELAKPELWSFEYMRDLIPDDSKLHEFVHLVIDDLYARGGRGLEGMMCSMLVLGHLLGMKAKRQAN